MSKRKQYRQAQQEVFDAKLFYAKVLKRYGIMLAITVPIILAVNFLLSYLMPETYKGAVVYVVILLVTKEDEEKSGTIVMEGVDVCEFA